MNSYQAEHLPMVIVPAFLKKEINKCKLTLLHVSKMQAQSPMIQKAERSAWFTYTFFTILMYCVSYARPCVCVFCLYFLFSFFFNFCPYNSNSKRTESTKRKRRRKKYKIDYILLTFEWSGLTGCRRITFVH